MRTAAAKWLGVLLGVALCGSLGCDDGPDKALVKSAPATAPTTGPSKFDTIDEAAAELSKLSGQPIRPFSTYDYGRRRDDRCRSVIIRSEDDASDYAHRIRPRLPLGVVVFVGTSTWKDGSDHGGGTEVIIGPGADQFDYLRLARTKAPHYDLDTEKLARRLNQFNEEYGIEIVVATDDSVVFRFVRAPWNFGKVADELYSLCPPIMTNTDFTTREKLIDYVRTAQYVELAWL